METAEEFPSFFFPTKGVSKTSVSVMVTSGMSFNDQSGGPGSETISPASNLISLDGLKEQIMSGDDHALKLRKPYTITKQRERWTEEEHKKFVEALKLYGRAWRHIEEHVGTKTAVQIRSHAQKFFSKVVRECNSGDASSIKPIEIPPPRPKRKPMHPYPRKLASPVKSRNPVAENLLRSGSASSILSIFEQENQSPTSVFSAIGSDTLGTSDSSTPNGTPSPVSSPTGVGPGGGVELPQLFSEENRSSSNQANTGSNIGEEEAVKLQLFPQDDCFTKEGTTGTSSGQCLKLFGKTVLVTDCHRPSSTQTPGSCKPLSVDVTGVQTLPWNMMPLKMSVGDSTCSWDAYSCDAPGMLYYLPLQKEISNGLEAGSAPPSLWWTSCADATFSSVQVYSPVPIKASRLSDNKGQDKDTQKEGSSTGSNTESVSLEGDEDKKSDAEAQSIVYSFVEEISLPSRSTKTALLERRGTSTSCNKGFVPYKRCLADRDTQSSTLASEERSEQRIRLCL